MKVSKRFCQKRLNQSYHELTRSVCVAVLTVSILAPIPDVLSVEMERFVELSKGAVVLFGPVLPFGTGCDSYLVIVFAWMRIVRSRSSIWLWNRNYLKFSLSLPDRLEHTCK